MRVLQVFQPVEGGVPYHVDTLARHLPDRGVDVVVACTPNPWARRLRDDGVPVVDVAMRREVSPAADRDALLRLYRLIATSSFDLVHTHSAKAGVLGRLAAWRRTVPAVHTPHAWSFEAAGRRPTAAVYRAIERTLAQRTARIICVSTGEWQQGLSISGPHRLAVVPNGVDLPSLDAGDRVGGGADGDIAVGTIARLAEQKGVDLLLAAMARLRHHRDDVRLVVAGDGPLRGELERLAHRLGVADHTTFLGEVATPWEVLAALDVFVLPSRWEGLPYTLLEAMAAGLPCVATAVNGVPDLIVDRRYGTVVARGDVERLAREILALVEDPPARRAIGDRARERVRTTFSVPAMITGTIEVYRQALDDASARTPRLRWWSGRSGWRRVASDAS